MLSMIYQLLDNYINVTWQFLASGNVYFMFPTCILMFLFFVIICMFSAKYLEP